MKLRYDVLATVAAIIMTCSSSLLAGDVGSLSEAGQTQSDTAQSSPRQKKPEVSCELKVREKYRYYDVDGTDVDQLRKQMKQQGTKWNDGKIYAAVTKWDIRYSYDVTYEDGRYAVKSVKTDVDIVYHLPRRIAAAQDPELTELWEEYLVALMEHEFGHKDLAVKAAGEINQVLAALDNFDSRKALDREADRRTEEKFRTMKKHQVDYDEVTHHGETQGAVLVARTPAAAPAKKLVAALPGTPAAALAGPPAAVLSGKAAGPLPATPAALLAANTPDQAAGDPQ